MRRELALALLLVLGSASLARADGDRIVKVKVVDNSKTDPNTVQAIAGLDEGDTATTEDLDTAKERLLASGLFKSVRLWTENDSGGKVLVISARDRISWFIAPTFSASKNSYGGGVAFGETNLFGWQKKLLLYAALSNTTGAVAVAYQDPAIRGSWAYFQIDGHYQLDQIYEYYPMQVGSPPILRATPLQTAGGGLTFGIRWWRKFKTEGRLCARNASYEDAEYAQYADNYQLLGSAYRDWQGMEAVAPHGASTDGTSVYAKVVAGWDGRASIQGVQEGMALLAGYEAGLPALGSDYGYWKAQLGFHGALRLFEEHNVILRGALQVAKDPPFFDEFEAGGSGFRGYISRQFRGDMRAYGSAEYVFPIIKLGGLHIRGLVFYDTNVSTFLEDPDCRPVADGGPACDDGYPYAERRPEKGPVRYYLPGQPFSFKREAWNNGVGGGLRFYLKSIAMPLVGVDYGYGIEGATSAVYVSVGMVN